jgi:hypothetical protein
VKAPLKKNFVLVNTTLHSQSRIRIRNPVYYLTTNSNVVQVLQYLARAYYKAGKMKEAKATLLKARRVAPQVRYRYLPT